MNFIKSKGSIILSLIAVGVSIYAIVVPKKETIIQKVDTNNQNNQIQLVASDGYLKWKLSTSSEWINLIKLDDLKGKDGIDGKDGTNGINGVDGKDGIDGKDGTDGKNGINGTDGKNGTDGTDGKDGTNGTNGINGVDGKDGREVEFRINNTTIEWKYTDEENWTALIDINELINSNKSKKNPIISSLNGSSTDFGCIDNETTCSVGSNIEVRVNNNTTYNFYILDDDGTKLTLILDRNLGETTSWNNYNSDEETMSEAYSKGPINALTELNLRTIGWDFITPIENYSYTNSDNAKNSGTYKGITIQNGVTTVTGSDDTNNIINGTARARMLTLEEAKAYGCNKSTDYSCSGENNEYKFIYENLKAEYGTTTPYGYWLLTTNSTNSSPYNVYAMHYTGRLNAVTSFDANTNGRGGRGVRPVIIIDKYNEE